MDLSMVERAAAGLALRLPRGPHRGKAGDVRASSVGSSMELHDFREYQPGDDVRHLDWNAVARTGQLYLRVRQEEVSPRVEVVLDASASMAVSAEKSARAREIALWACLLARQGGLEPSLVVVSDAPARVAGPAAAARLTSLVLDGKSAFDEALPRAPQLRTCGLRVVVSDFLVETPAEAMVTRLAREASGLALVRVLDVDDLEPGGGMGARLTDAETGQVLERILSADVLASYRARLDAHLTQWRAAARRVRGDFLEVSAADTMPDLVRGALAPLVEVGR